MEKIFNRKAAVSYFEIIIILLSVFSFSYIIFHLTEVHAQNLSFNCCEKTKEGGICQNVLSEDECEYGFHPHTKCEATSVCRLGCCIDDIEGTYDKNVPKALCKGRWEDDKNCNVPGAQKGCCVLGDSVAYVTDARCSRLSELRGLNKDYRRGLNEAECIALSMTQEKGACVLPGGNCKFTTAQECISLTGSSSNFYANYLCTAPQLNTICNRTDKTTCVEGKDGVYFVDSCGNPANIYDASKINDDEYWEKVVPLNESCNPLSGNANSKSCGNCNRFLGGICASALEDNFKPIYGDFYCKPTFCEFKGKIYKNGESWCVYDGKIGDGDDVVGSRHWKYVCNQGEIQVEPCADYRNEICVQSETNLSNGEKFRNAACRVNNWRECIDANSDRKKIDECDKKLDCIVQSVNVDDGFKFNLCVPKYPEGFGFEEEQQEIASKICGIATQSCKVIYVKKLFGGCKCVANCNCEKAIFTQQMNEACRKLGDCGGYVNIEGVYTDAGYSVKNAPKLSRSFINKYIKNAVPVPGLFAEVGDVEKYLKAAGLIGVPQNLGNLTYNQGIGKSVAAIGGGMLGVGFGIALASAGFNTPLNIQEVITIISSAKISSSLPSFAAFGYAAMSLGIAVGITGLASALLGIKDPSATLVAVVASVATTLVSMTVLQIPFLVSGIAGAIVGLIILLIFRLMGIGKVCKKVIVTYTCKPWQPPVGGNDCEKCNNDPLKPCSEYRCRSLGTACKLINKGKADEMCVEDNPNDVTPPTIKPRFGTISNDSQYTDITDNGFRITNLQGGCLEAYKPLLFGITTNEPAYCKFDLTPKDFEEMQFDFGSSSYVYNHTTVFSLPDPSHGQSMGYNWSGDLTLYIKCRDTHGNEISDFYTISMCVNQGPDTTPPLIKATDPENNALLAYNLTSKRVKIWTNEPAECRWSFDDKDYDSMENEFTCKNDVEDISIFGYECSAELPISNENKFYFRCKDQPWLNDSSERNANQESFVYVLRKVENPLQIDWIEPSSDFEVSSVPATVVLKVHTSGGGDYPRCSYSFTGYDNMILFFNTYSELHEQEFNLVSGEYEIYIECSDEVGDVVRDVVNFRVIHDSASPQIARIWREGKILKIITDEDSECSYSCESCNFDFDSGIKIGKGKEHSISIIKGKTYYIKCKDEFGNIPSFCSAIVKPT